MGRRTLVLQKHNGSRASTPADQSRAASWWPDWEHLAALLSAGRGTEATAYARQLGERWPDVPEIQHYARALRPPTVRKVTGTPAFRSLDADYAWLREHAHRYPGQWLAVFDGHLVANGTEFRSVVEHAATVTGGDQAILYYQRALAE